MYTPKQFVNHNTEEIKDFIRQNSFGILTSVVEGVITATHVPLELSADSAKLSGHVSRANKQWKSFQHDAEVLAIFSGPHTYVSSSWYDTDNVPTWNYIAAHVYGKIEMIEGDALYRSLQAMVNRYEQHSKQPVALERMPSDYLERMMQGIVGFEITITNIEASFKLSQNRNEKSYNNIIHELSKRSDEQSHQVAAAMKRNSHSIFGF